MACRASVDDGSCLLLMASVFLFVVFLGHASSLVPAF